MRHLVETYAIQNSGFCWEWFCAQAYVKVGVGALHRGMERRNNANKKVVCSIVGRTGCGVVDRREIDGKKMERKPRLKKNI